MVGRNHRDLSPHIFVIYFLDDIWSILLLLWPKSRGGGDCPPAPLAPTAIISGHSTNHKNQSRTILHHSKNDGQSVYWKTDRKNNLIYEAKTLCTTGSTVHLFGFLHIILSQKSQINVIQHVTQPEVSMPFDFEVTDNYKNMI